MVESNGDMISKTQNNAVQTKRPTAHIKTKETAETNKNSAKTQ